MSDKQIRISGSTYALLKQIKSDMETGVDSTSLGKIVDAALRLYKKHLQENQITEAYARVHQDPRTNKRATTLINGWLA